MLFHRLCYFTGCTISQKIAEIFYGQYVCDAIDYTINYCIHGPSYAFSQLIHKLEVKLLNRQNESEIKSPSSIRETLGWESLKKEERKVKSSSGRGSQSSGTVLIQKQKTKGRLGTGPVESSKEKAREGREKSCYRYQIVFGKQKETLDIQPNARITFWKRSRREDL